MHATTVVGYAYNADIYCPIHTLLALDAIGEDAVIYDVETDLDAAARERGIDREREWSFDSDDFPKAIFADQAISAEGENVEDGLFASTCGVCGEPLIP